MAVYDVVCAGIIVADHVAAPVDHLPAAGELVLTDECFLALGGCASNVAVDLAKQRISTTVCGCVGDDSFGNFVRQTLTQAGLDVGGIHVAQQSATSQTLIVNVRGQDRRFIHHLGANQVFAGRHFPRELVRQAKLLYVGGYFLLDGLQPTALAEVFQEARQHGVVTVLDVVTPGPRDYPAALQRILPYTDYFMPNRDEARLMTGAVDPVKQAELLRQWGAGCAIIKQGAEGAILVTENARLRAGVFETEFVDGTGGGDAFDAGFIRGLLEGAAFERCLELGSALGASCVRRSGATAGVYSRAEVDAFLTDHRLMIAALD